jgi:hypothetical protein
MVGGGDGKAVPKAQVRGPGTAGQWRVAAGAGYGYLA